MQFPFRITAITALAFLAFQSAMAQDKLEDGTSLVWDKAITVGHGELKADTLQLPALTVPVYEASASQVSGMLGDVIPGASFKKKGKVFRAPAVIFPAGASTPVDMVATVTGDKKQGMSVLSLTMLQNGKPVDLSTPAAEAAVHDLGVKLNKAVVQKQLDAWKKKLSKAGSKAESAAKANSKAQDKLIASQADLEKITKEKSKLQNDHAVLEKEIALLNQKWTLSQSSSDLKKLTKARGKIAKNEAKMAKVMQDEAKAQKAHTKNTEALPEAQQAKEDQAAGQAAVQRTVDALQRKLEAIR